MCRSVEFRSLKEISDISNKLVETKRHVIYPLFYKLMKLALILFVATITVERSFSAIKIFNNGFRNRIEDEWIKIVLWLVLRKMCSTKIQYFTDTKIYLYIELVNYFNEFLYNYLLWKLIV